MGTTLFEVAGGSEAMLALATAHHARCLADTVLNHPFSHDDQHPEHVARLAAYWGEVLGGPSMYSDELADQHHVTWLHSGIGDVGDLGERFHRCFVEAMDDAGLPADPALRAALDAYMAWAVAEVLTWRHVAPDDVPRQLSTPRWSWDGLVEPA